VAATAELDKAKADAIAAADVSRDTIRGKNTLIAASSEALTRGQAAIDEAEKLKGELLQAHSDKDIALKDKQDIQSRLDAINLELSDKMTLPGFVEASGPTERSMPGGVKLGKVPGPMVNVETLKIEKSQLEKELNNRELTLQKAISDLRTLAEKSDVDIAKALVRAEKAEATSKTVEEALQRAQAAEENAKISLRTMTNVVAATHILQGPAFERHAQIKAENTKLLEIVINFIRRVKNGEVNRDIDSIERELAEFPADAMKRVNAALAIIDAIEPHITNEISPVRQIERVLRNVPNVEGTIVEEEDGEWEGEGEGGAEEAEEAEVEVEEEPVVEEPVVEEPKQEEPKSTKDEVSSVKDELKKYDYITTIPDDIGLKTAYTSLLKIESPTKANLAAFIKSLEEYIKNSEHIKDKSIFLINIITTADFGKMLNELTLSKGRTTTRTIGAPITINNINKDLIGSLKGTPSKSRVPIPKTDIPNIIKYFNKLLEGDNLKNRIEKAISDGFTSNKAIQFFNAIKIPLTIKIRGLIGELITLLTPRTHVQSGGSNVSKEAHLCDLMLSSILLKLDSPDFNHKSLIDKAGKVLDDIGQCDLVLDMLNHLVDEHCLINKTNGYVFSSVYMDIPQARALVEAFNNNFTDKEKQNFYEISSGIFNYKVPDEHQIFLGKHPFFLVGNGGEEEETPLYGVIDDELTLTKDERAVLEEDGVPIGAILFLYIVCFREYENHESCIHRPSQ
jgi:hypothetical protein